MNAMLLSETGQDRVSSFHLFMSTFLNFFNEHPEPLTDLKTIMERSMNTMLLSETGQNRVASFHRFRRPFFDKTTL